MCIAPVGLLKSAGFYKSVDGFVQSAGCTSAEISTRRNNELYTMEKMMPRVNSSYRVRRALRFAALSAVLATAACGKLMTMMHGGPERPPESEFGFGPRTSAGAMYTATLEPVAPLKQRKLQQVRLIVRTADNRPVDGATIAVDGGMPQHGHGLPTAPKVTRSLGDGTYQVDGVKFNMGGWWELKFRIAGAAGVDSVTFNLAL